MRSGERTAPAGGRPLRIAVLTNMIAPYTTQIFERLATDHGCELLVVYETASEPNRSWELPDALPYEHVVLRSLTVDLRRLVPELFLHLPWRPTAPVSRFRPDVVVAMGGAWTSPANLAAVWARRRKGWGLVSVYESIQHPEPSLLQKLAAPFSRRVMSASDAWIVPGRRAFRRIVGLGADPDRTVIAPTIPSLPRTAASDDRSRRQDGEPFTFLYVGRLVEEKGLRYLAEAVRSLPEVRLWLAGDGPLQSELEALLPPERVQFFGHVDWETLQGLYGTADALVFPSLYDVWGLVVNEALAQGLPVIATDQVGAVDDLVEEGVNGLVVPARSSQALVDAMREITTWDEARRERAAAVGREKVAWYRPEVAAQLIYEACRTAQLAARPAAERPRRLEAARRPTRAGSRGLRVLLVNKFGHVTGGADQHVIGLAAALREQDHEVRVLTTQSPLNVERDGRFVPLLVTNANRGELSALRRAEVAGRAVWNWSAASHMRALIDEFEPDVIHVHKLYPQISVAPVVLGRRGGIPVVQTLHDLELIAANPIAPGGEWRDRTEERADYRALNTATFAIRRYLHRPGIAAFVAPSRFVADTHRRFGIEAEVIPNFTEFAGKRDLPGYDDRSGILFVGRLSTHKGILDVLELAQSLSGYPVTIAGAGPLEEHVRAETARLPNVTYLGPASRSELESLFAAARVLVMPSSFPEIGPLTAIEAMAHGTPVVGYDHSGLAEYVTDAGGGVIVEAGAEALTRAAAHVYDDRAAWERLSAAASAAVAAHHSPGEYAGRVVDVYAGALNGRPAATSR